jgi:hypothetical protein
VGCIDRNFGQGEADRLERIRHWSCFHCSPSSLCEIKERAGAGIPRQVASPNK